MLGWIITIILIIIGIWLYNKFFKIPKMNSLVMITGGVKSGKSTTAVYFCIKKHKKILKKIKRINWLRTKIFKKKELELPKLYSNIPLAVEYTPLTKKMILREERLAYRSVVYISEASLLANSMAWKDNEKNEKILLFFKLFGHETLGGTCIIDTQCIQDVHFAIKRSISEYFYIHHLTKIPFFIIAHVRECIYSEDGSVQNNYNEDLEETLKRIIIPKSVWKKFDPYTYSILTDNLKLEENKQKNDRFNLKTKNIISFNEYKTINKKEVKNEEKNNKMGS